MVSAEKSLARDYIACQQIKLQKATAVYGGKASYLGV